jgi:hypothetical protein
MNGEESAFFPAPPIRALSNSSPDLQHLLCFGNHRAFFPSLPELSSQPGVFLSTLVTRWTDLGSQFWL